MNCYQCEECGKNMSPEDAIPTSVDDWDGEPVQLHICAECARDAQYDYEDFAGGQEVRDSVSG